MPYLDDCESDIDVCSISNIVNDHGDHVIIQLNSMYDFDTGYELADPSEASSFHSDFVIKLPSMHSF